MVKGGRVLAGGDGCYKVLRICVIRADTGVIGGIGLNHQFLRLRLGIRYIQYIPTCTYTHMSRGHWPATCAHGGSFCARRMLTSCALHRSGQPLVLYKNGACSPGCLSSS